MNAIRVFRLSGLFAICIHGVPPVALAGTFYVSPNGTHVSPFATWETAATDIQSAVNAAGQGDTVIVTNGTYVLSTEISIDKGITVTSVNGPEFTIVDGNQSTRCIRLSHENAVVKGLTITGGRVLRSPFIGDPGIGGGVLCDQGGGNGGTVQDCTISGNFADDNGGGVYCFFPGIVQHCTITGNSSGGSGGGVECIDGTVQHCTITDNSAGGGGGVTMYGSAIVRHCVITGNSASRDGGGVLNIFADLQNCIVSGNSASRDGGGMKCEGSTTVQNCTISGNSADSRGGGVMSSGATALENCIVYFNTALAGDPNYLHLGTGWSYAYSCATPIVTGVDNFDADPLLTLDFRLQAGSPCIDAGNDTSAPLTDIDGEPRSDHPDHSNVVSIVDVGADEIVDPDADSDGDGLKDVEEFVLGTNSLLPDTDGDGVKDGAEILSGTDPTNPDSYLAMEDVSRQSVSANVVRWWSESNIYYNLLRSGDLGAGFSTAAMTIVGTPPINTYRDVGVPESGSTHYVAELANNPPALPQVIAGPVTNVGNGHTYHLLNQSTWVEAETAAVALGGHLATIRNTNEQAFVYNTFANWAAQPRNLCIGLYDPDMFVNATDVPGRRLEFSWISGELVNYANWDPNEPNDFKSQGEFWVHMIEPRSVGNAGAWNDVWNTPVNDLGFGSAPLNGVVELMTDPADLPQVMTGPITNMASGNIYFLLDQSTWLEAEMAAVAMGGHLATIRNTNEQDFIYNSFSDWGGAPRNLCIGLYDADPVNNSTNSLDRRQEFGWISRESVIYMNWAPNEPNDWNMHGEFWVHMVEPRWVAGAGMWNDVWNTDENNFGFGAAPLHGVVEITTP
jgi:hypothetical protein